MTRSNPLFSLLCVALLSFLNGGCPNDNGGGGGGGGGGGSDPVTPTAGTEVQTLEEQPLSGICQTAGGAFFVSSNGGKPLTSADGTKFSILDNMKVDLRGVHCDRQSAAINVWFVGAAGTILKYDGTSLASQESTTTNDLSAVFGTDSSFVTAVGASGTIVHFGGNTWVAEDSMTTQGLFGVAGSTSQNPFFAVGSMSAVQQSSGSTWSTVDVSAAGVLADTQLNAAWADPVSGDIFVVGNAGTILRRTGVAWAKLTSPTSSNLLGVHGTSNSQVFAVGAAGTVLSFDGTTWTKEDAPDATGFQLNGVAAVSSASGYAVGSNGMAGLLLKRGSTAWEKVL